MIDLLSFGEMTKPAITASYGNATLETKAATSGTSSPEPWFLDLLGGSPTSSKVRVGPTTAMRVPAVARAVNLIAGVFGHLPCRVLKIDDFGEAPAPDHPAFPIVSRRANPWTGAGQFRAQLVRDMLLHGNGYAYANRAGGKLRELIHLPAGSVTVEIDEATREPHYSVTVDGAVRAYHWSKIVHLSAPSLDGVSGKSPVHLGREAIGLAIVLERHAGRLFGNGSREFVRAYGEAEVGEAVFRVRYLAGITTADRIVFDGEALELVEVAELGRRAGLDLRTKTLKA